MWSFDWYWEEYLRLCSEQGLVAREHYWIRNNVAIGADPKEAFVFFHHELAQPTAPVGAATGSIEATLAERGARYGSFVHHAETAQALQDDMRGAHGWDKLAPDQKQALSVIADKIARMLNGDPNYIDNWHDIIGYAKLVEDRLKLEQSV